MEPFFIKESREERASEYRSFLEIQFIFNSKAIHELDLQFRFLHWLE